MSAIAPFVAHSFCPVSSYPPSTGVAVVARPRRVRADVGLGQQERADLVPGHQREPLALLLLGPEQLERSATPIDWWALSSVESDACQTPASASARL